MKKFLQPRFFSFFFTLALLTSQVVLFAQDSTSKGSNNVTPVNPTGLQETPADQWYSQPWVWVVGGVLLLIILIALFRGGKSTHVSEKTTVIRK